MTIRGKRPEPPPPCGATKPQDPWIRWFLRLIQGALTAVTSRLVADWVLAQS